MALNTALGEISAGVLVAPFCCEPRAEAVSKAPKDSLALGSMRAGQQTQAQKLEIQV